MPFLYTLVHMLFRMPADRSERGEGRRAVPRAAGGGPRPGRRARLRRVPHERAQSCAEDDVCWVGVGEWGWGSCQPAIT